LLDWYYSRVVGLFVNKLILLVVMEQMSQALTNSCKFSPTNRCPSNLLAPTRLALLSFLLLCFSLPVFAETLTEQTPEASEVTVEEEPQIVPEPTPYQPQFPPGAINQFRIEKMPKSTGRIAFTASISDLDRILVLDLSSRRIIPLIGEPGNNWYPGWSPDGMKLVFSSDRDGFQTIYISDWDGTNQFRLSDHPQPGGDPSWFPDGESIVHYLEEEGRGQSSIYRTDVATGKSERLTKSDSRNTTPRVSPDARFVAFSSNRNWPGWDVCLYDTRSGSEDCIIKGTTPYCRPAWSIGGDRIMYSAGSGQQINLGEYQLSARSMRTVTRMPGREYDVTYSPDGKEIIFVAEGDTPGNYNIYHMPVDAPPNQGPSLLLSSPFSIRFLSWAARSTVELEVERIKQQELMEQEAQLEVEIPLDSELEISEAEDSP